MDIKELGKKIRQLRTNKNLSQENVANDLGISVTAFSKIERGETNIPFKRLVQISEYFGLKVKDFFQLNEKKENKNQYVQKEEQSNIVSDTETKYITDIENLKNEIIQLKELLKAKDEIINLLKQNNQT
ncbi:MAG: helix-turn-helix transcriptional regulator [Bacteroidales bacterium]|jgi:transcriptional regulator with XRE-family HTH domain